MRRPNKPLPLSSERTTCLYMPAMVLDAGETELLGDFCSRHGSFDVLLVGKHKYSSFSKILKKKKDSQNVFL